MIFSSTQGRPRLGLFHGSRSETIPAASGAGQATVGRTGKRWVRFVRRSVSSAAESWLAFGQCDFRASPWVRCAHSGQNVGVGTASAGGGGVDRTVVWLDQTFMSHLPFGGVQTTELAVYLTFTESSS